MNSLEELFTNDSNCLQEFDYYDRRYEEADMFERRYSGMRGGSRDYPGGMRGGRDMGPLPPMPRNGGSRMEAMFSRRSPPSRSMRGFGYVVSFLQQRLRF